MKVFLRDILITAVVTVVIFVLVQTTFQISIINGYCMEPQLQDGQRLLVNKVIFFFHQPERGDIIIFHPPNDVGESPYIKRIIGLPGETVEIKRGIVYINGSPLDEPYVREPPNYTFHQKKILEKNYFVLGDNRNNSNDSHNGWTVPRQNILGKAWLSIWPPEEWGLAPNYSSPEYIAGSTS